MDQPAPRCTRRRFACSLAISALALPAAGAPRGAAAAGWCRKDPQLRIGAKSTNIFLEYRADRANTCTGPIRLVVTVPPGTATAVLSQDEGFGHGYTVTFRESAALDANGNSLRVRVEAFVPAAGAMECRVVSEPVDNPQWHAAKQGPANAWIALDARV